MFVYIYVMYVLYVMYAIHVIHVLYVIHRKYSIDKMELSDWLMLWMYCYGYSVCKIRNECNLFSVCK